MQLASFFDAVRPLMKNGRLTFPQVRGFEAVVLECLAQGITLEHTAYILATAYHETGGRMEPVREGFASTDAGSRRAVERLYDKGVISRNYAAPASNGNSYYGRGLVQLTHLANYAKTGHELGIDLVTYPDKMLDLTTSVKAIIWGMKTGSYRNRTLAKMLPFADPTPEEWKAARNIINGDTRKNGKMIADYAIMFHSALKGASDGNI